MSLRILIKDLAVGLKIIAVFQIYHSIYFQLGAARQPE